MGADCRGSVQAPVRRDHEAHTEPLPDRLSLRHHRPGNGARLSVGGDHVEGGEREGAYRVERQVAPQLQPDLISDGAHRRLEPGCGQRLAESHDAVGFRAPRFAEGETVPLDVAYDPWFDHLGGRVHDTTDDTVGADGVPLQVPRVHRLQPVSVPFPAVLVEVPPRYAVDGRDHRRVFVEQMLNRSHDGGHRRRLDGDDHVVVGADLGRVVGTPGVDHVLVVVDQKLETVRSHGREVWPAGYQSDVGAG